MTSTPSDSAYCGDDSSRQGGDGSSEWSTNANDASRHAPAGQYVAYTAYGMAPCSPVMHHRPMNTVEYVHLGQPCCCPAPMAYGHPMTTPFSPIVSSVCADQLPPSVLYPHMMPPMYASPFAATMCQHHTCTSQTVQYAGHGSACAKPPPQAQSATECGSPDALSTMSSEERKGEPTSEASTPGQPPPRVPTPMSIDSLSTAVSKPANLISVSSTNAARSREPLASADSRCNRQEVEATPSKEADPPLPVEKTEEASQAVYKASVRMDIPFSAAPVQQRAKEPPKRLVHRTELQRTTAFTIQFSDEQRRSGTMGESAKAKKALTSGRKAPTMPPKKGAGGNGVQEAEETDADDAVSECGTYTVEEECSYFQNKQHVQRDSCSTLLKELIKISNGSTTPSTKKDHSPGRRVGPGSPVTKRAGSRAASVHQGQQEAAHLQRSDGGRYSMRAKVTSSPCRSVGNSPRQLAPPGPSPETVAWLRRKEYNPLKASSKSSTTSDGKLLSNRSKSFHAGPQLDSTSHRSQPTTTKTNAPTILPSPSSLRGQVFVELGSLKKLQTLSVDLMTSASSLKARHSQMVGKDDLLEPVIAPVLDGNSSCPLSDVIKKLTIVDRALKQTHELVDLLEKEKSPTMDNSQQDATTNV